MLRRWLRAKSTNLNIGQIPLSIKPHATTTTQLAQPPRPLQSTNEHPPLELALLHHEVLRRPFESTQYLSVRYTNRLAESQIVASVGSKGDSYDNALAETTIGLYKTELIRNRGPWRDLDHTTFATLEYIDWFNHRRLHRGITPDTTYTTPAEHETNYHQTNPTTPQIAQTTNPL